MSSRQGQKFRKKEETIRNNLKQYELQDKFIDILVADFSTKYLKKDFEFDAIITDPPYGIREKTKKIGSKKNKRNKLKNQNENENNEKIKISCSSSSDSEEAAAHSNEFHSPQHTNYMLGEIFHDLLDFSVEHLNENGRLTFWLPIFLDVERDKLTCAIFLDLIKLLVVCLIFIKAY